MQTIPQVASSAPDLQRQSVLADLVHRMASGDQDALTTLYDETSPSINGLLVRMLRDREDSEEALLDVYLKAWRHAPYYSADKSAVRPWLSMMARGIAIDRIRRRRANAQPQGYEPATSRADSPEQQTLHSERRGQVERILASLPGEQREVLLMAFFSGYTHSELSASLGLPLGTVKTRIRTALLKLRDLLEQTPS